MICKNALLFLACLTFHSPSLVRGHGFLQSPRSRNFYAHDIISTNECSGSAGCPPAEYCEHCLNGNTGVCGKSPSHNYETSAWLDRNGDPMPWIAQGTYHEGGTMKVDSYLDTHHNGHMEIRACVIDAADPASCTTPEEFEGNELHFVQDLIHPQAEGSHPPMPPDPMYPERGMYAGGQGGATKSFSFEYRLPSGIRGERVLLQWKYITANSCSPPGYATYFAAHPDLPNSYWTQGVSDCTPPYPNDGSRSTTFPEQFFNCAEVTILSSGTSSPTISRKPTPNPTTAQPTLSKPPTNSPIVGGPTCLAEWQDCTYDSQNCCEGYKCKQIDASGYRRCLEDTCYNGPPSPPANPPPPTWNPPTTPNPTPKPTSPTDSPPTPPTNSEDACCTINLRDCHHPVGNFCRLNKENCEGPCGKLWLPNGPLNGCIALWEQGCSSDSDCCQHGKCNAGSCESDDPWLKDPSPTTEMPSMMPITHSPTTPPTTRGSTGTPTYYPTDKATPVCTVCDDKETNWQTRKGFDCATDTVRINNKCNKDEKWTKKKFCRLSCYKAGKGYPGDVCCT